MTACGQIVLNVSNIVVVVVIVAGGGEVFAQFAARTYLERWRESCFKTFFSVLLLG